MVEGFTFKKTYDFDDLVGIVAILRAPGGCPWDKEQTHRSIRSNFIEETYEAIEAIDTDDASLLCEELGDVLLQVALHSQIEKESGGFNINDVVDGVAKKLIVRHPHVFGDVIADNTDQVLKNWDDIKKHTKGQKSQSETLKSVSRALPALMRSSKVQQRASRSGFDWPDEKGAVDKIHEELSELEAEISKGSKEGCIEEIGDLLFAAVNASRKLGIDPEEALTASCDKFTQRFSKCEEFASQQDKKLSDLNPEELDELWNKSKTVLLSNAERP